MSIEPALKFVSDLPHPNDRGNLLLHFRERGFAVLKNVFQRDSVAAYLEQVKGQVVAGPTPSVPLMLKMDSSVAVWPAKAPRLRHVLRGAFSSWISEPQVALLNPGWLIRPANPDPKIVHDWHKDADHLGVGNIGSYQYPSVVHALMYFTDMTPAHGPTHVIPRSHRDPTLSPFGGAQEEPLLCEKSDVVLWDQRTWHRGAARTVEGLRIMALFSFYPLPINDTPRPMPEAQRAAWLSSTDATDKITFGGPFEPSC